MIRRSAAVVLAVTLQRLAAGRLDGLTEDQELVLRALRRSTNSLATASNEELGDYIRSLSPEQLRGVVSNVKGIYHELLVERAENVDGDAVMSRIFDATNQPGADIEFLIDGDVVREVQLKAVQSPAAIVAHFSRYPEINVVATSEVYASVADAFPGRIADSGFSNAELSAMTKETLNDLDSVALADVMQDGVVTSTLVAGALQARAVLVGQPVDAAAMRLALESAGIGIATATVVEALLGVA